MSTPWRRPLRVREKCVSETRKQRPNKLTLYTKPKGCAGFAAVASDVTFGLDADQVIKAAINLAKAALEAAARVPTIKRFVQTSSSTAAVKHEVPAGTPHDVPVDHYNTYAIEKAYRTDGAAAQDPQQALWVYSASKALQEQAVWQWRDEHQKQEGGLPFAVSTVLPDFVLGAVLSPANQGYPTSAGYAKAAWDGDLSVAVSLPPQYEVDTGDIALLHVAALLHPGIGDGERIFGFAFRKNLTTLLRSMRAQYPDRAFLDAPAGEKEYLAEIQGRARAEELLTWAKGSGWTGADESVKAFCDSLL